MFSERSFTYDSKEAELLLRAAAMKVIDLSFEMGEITTLVQKDIEDHFNKERSPVGKWRKRKDNKTHPILNLSGALKRSITSKASANIGKLTISIKSDLIYAKVHNNGMTIRNRGGGYTQMPKRQFAWISKDVRDKSMEIIIKGVLDA